MRFAPFFAAMTLFAVSPVQAQAPRPLPASLNAQVGLPDSATPRFANLDLELSEADWVVVGCVSTVLGSCRRTRRVVLTTAQRTTFVQLWAAVGAMPRCEPAGFSPGDPAYTITTPAATYTGHLPARSTDLPTRTAGECLADARLAYWLAQQLGP